MEFNPDGSLRIPGQYRKEKKGVNIRKDIVSEYAPKKCVLSVTGKMDRVAPIVTAFSGQTPIKKLRTEDGFEVEIGSDFARCSDCRELVFRISSACGGDCSVDEGTCTYKGRQQQFSYEDYFD